MDFDQDFTQMLREVGVELVNSDPQLAQLATAWNTAFANRFPDFTPEQTEKIFTFFAVTLDGVVFRTDGTGDLTSTNAADALTNLAVSLAAAGLFAGAESTTSDSATNESDSDVAE